MPKVSDAQLGVAKELIAKRAQREGMSPDEYVKTYFAGIESGDKFGRAQFFQKESIKYQISELFDYAISKASNVLRKVELWKLDDNEAAIIKEKTNLDVSGYTHVIDNYAINHMLNEHGISSKEIARGMVAITKEDIALIPEIISNPDNITSAGNTRVGREAILYVKKFNGDIYYLEERRTGNQELAAVTLYKKKGAATSNAPEGVPSVTSKTFRAPSDKTIPLSDESVKKLEQTHDKRAKGAVEFLEDGRAVIHAFEGADITTVVHELGHIFRRQIKGDDIRILEDWTGVKEGKWERQHEEQLAKGFERYLAEGKAPSEELKTVFEKFKIWILDIYRKLIHDDIWRTSLNSEVRAVFDRLFVESELPLRKTEHPEAVEARKVAEIEIKQLQEDAKKEIDLNQPIPKERTVVEDWGTAETFRPQREGKKQSKTEPLKKADLSEIEEEVTSGAGKEAYSKQHLEFIRDRLLTSEGVVTSRLSSGYPEWFQNRGYKQKEIVGIINKALEGKKLTERQWTMLDDLIASSEREFGKAKPILNEAVERIVEDIFLERDVPYIKGYDAEGKLISGSMKDYIDEARAEYKEYS
jgi:hypothetical protein